MRGRKRKWIWGRREAGGEGLGEEEEGEIVIGLGKINELIN